MGKSLENLTTAIWSFPSDSQDQNGGALHFPNLLDLEISGIDGATLGKLLSGSSNLRSLRLMKNHFDFDIIAKNMPQSVTLLWCVECHIPEKSIYNNSRALFQNIKDLVISHSLASPSSIFFKNNISKKLTGNGITDTCFFSLATAARQVEILELCSTRVTPKTIRMIAGNGKLRKFYNHDNRGLAKQVSLDLAAEYGITMVRTTLTGR